MKSIFWIYFTIIFIFLCSFILSLSLGSTVISFRDFFQTSNFESQIILLQLRLPRSLTAFTCGGLLALAGSYMQLLLRNPLADPYVLGISSGAAFFILLSMLLGFSESWLLPAAWLGSLLTILIILLLSRRHQFQPFFLLLAGIALACGFSAAISCLLVLSPATTLQSMLFWISGDLNSINFPWFGLSILGFGFLISLLLAPGMNILRRSEIEALSLGLNCKQYRVGLYLLASLFTAVAVTLGGCIGFIGLIIPHFTRLLVGHDHRINLPFNILLGGSLLIIADTCARTLLAPQQLPVGILMALIGVPLFIWCLQK